MAQESQLMLGVMHASSAVVEYAEASHHTHKGDDCAGNAHVHGIYTVLSI